jgi:excinuclease UvrABC nuclease subunit
MSSILVDIENPLKKILARDDCKKLPTTPGNYFFWSEIGTLLYVGKAKCLKKRLLSYRNCSPLRLSRKIRHLVHMTRKITWQELDSELDALLEENKLLRSTKPVFNRVNTKPESYPYLCLQKVEANHLRLWRHFGDHREVPSEELHLMVGAFKGRRRLYEFLEVLGRLTVLLLAEAGEERPFLRTRRVMQGSARGPQLNMRFETPPWKNWTQHLESYLLGKSSRFHSKLQEKLAAQSFDIFTVSVLQTDLELLSDFHEEVLKRMKRSRRRHSVAGTIIAKDEVDDLIVKEYFTGT